MAADRIPLARPCTGQEEIEEVRRVLESGQLSQGPKVAEFERHVAEIVGVRHAFATSSCTTALHLSLVALGIGPGDEVLVPDFTFPATANVVVQQGAVPVLVDIDLETYNVDVAGLTEHVTPRTKAVMPVHLFGLSADMSPLEAFAFEHGLQVIEDAACALGATYRGRPCGSLGDVGCFSFHARKIVTTGEGGMVVTDDDEVAARLRLLRSHGGVRDDHRSRFEAAGFNYRLSDIHAAVGIAQLRRLPMMVERRRELAAALAQRLKEVPGVGVPVEPAFGVHVYQAFVVLLDEDVDRDVLATRLRSMGIEATLGTYALHVQPFFQQRFGYEKGQLPSSLAAFERTLALPLYPDMRDEDVDVVVQGLTLALPAARRVERT